MSRYQLKKLSHEGQSPSQKGVYLDSKTGKLVFIKTASRSEYASQWTLFHLSQVPNNSKVVIPQPFTFTQIDGHPSIVMEYFPQSKKITSSTASIKVKVYLEIMSFLQNLPSQTFTNKLPAYFQLLSLPYVFIKNIIQYPAHGFLFFRASMSILRNGLDWIFLKSDHVCHGDINITNILVQREKVILLDFAKSFISHKYYNLSQVLNSAWFHTSFHEKLNQAIIKTFSLSEHEQKVLNTFVIYNLLLPILQQVVFVMVSVFFSRKQRVMVVV